MPSISDYFVIDSRIRYAKNREIQIKDTIAMGQLELINSGKKFLATEGMASDSMIDLVVLTRRDETFTIFALDFETYEWSHDKVLEAGLTQCQVPIEICVCSSGLIFRCIVA